MRDHTARLERFEAKSDDTIAGVRSLEDNVSELKDLLIQAHRNEQRLIDRAAARGLLIEGARHHFSEPDDAPAALVLGYGSLDESEIPRGIAALGEINTG